MVTGTRTYRGRIGATDAYNTLTVGDGKLVIGNWRGMICMDALTGLQLWTSS